MPWNSENHMTFLQRAEYKNERGFKVINPLEINYLRSMRALVGKIQNEMISLFLRNVSSV